MANRAFERQEAGGFLRQKVLEFSNAENPYPKRKPRCGWIVVDSVLSLPALKKTESGQKQGVRKDSRSLP
jgi:hypothetical protein